MNEADVLQPGELILDGKYRVEAQLGKGAFARVYRVLHLKLQQMRAVKVITPDTPGVGSTVLSDYRSRFEQEAQLGSKLESCSNVVRVYDFEESAGRLCLMLEYMAGGSLGDRLRQYTEQGALMPVEEAVRLTLQAAVGLVSLHGLRAVHRDIKPSNILLDEAGNAKIADLGLAQTAADTSRRSALGSLAPDQPGTPQYMSPEQAGSRDMLYPTSDVYSLGCVLFELLTGKVWRQEMPYIREVRDLRPEVPEDVAVVLGRMLRQTPGRSAAETDDPSRRYVTMEAVQAALAGVQQGLAQRVRWADLYRRGQEALARRQWPAAVESLQALLEQAGEYEDAAVLLEQAQAGLAEADRETAVAGLVAQAEKALEKEAWPELERVVAELRPLSIDAAAPFEGKLREEQERQQQEQRRREAAEQQEQRRRQLADWYHQAEQMATSDPQGALVLLTRVRQEDADYPGLAELQRRAQARLAEQRRGM